MADSTASTDSDAGRVGVVTGAGAGIGRETLRGLARLGFTVALVVRSQERGRAAMEDVMRTDPGADLRLVLCDLSRQADVRRAAAEILDRFSAVHVLVNDAAAYTRRRVLTEDGVEMQLAVNHLAPYLLTRLLLGRLTASAPARVVTVSSAGHERGRVPWDDLDGTRRYRGFQRYCDTKLMNLLFTRELARRTANTGVTTNAMHPGVVGTELLFGGFTPLRLFRRWMRTPAEGARTAIHLAAAPDVEGVTGRYFIDERPAEPAPHALDAAGAARLWDVSARLVGLD
ncbi:MAG: short-chain dehydrogenase/reductase [Gemmatimonadetes bacterium]|nr:short-chain dehydrogenase/reductase [Gemmatimonadota bacterium]